jgi:quercetin dioxygenase-like cupin family protein
MANETLPDDLMWELMVGALDPIAPPPDGRRRLLAAVQGSARFLPFYADLCRHFDLSRQRVAELLSKIDEPGAWTRGIEPIQGFLDFVPGPRCEALRAGLVRMNPGAQFARHRHVDREITYVLEGIMRDGEGTRFGAGQAIEMAAGSEHALLADGDTPVLLALLHGSIEMLG